MKRLFRKNQIIITSLAIMIVIAGYLNFTADQTKPVKQEAAAETAEKIREENIQAEEAAAGAEADITSFPDEDLASVSAEAESTADTETPEGEKVGEAVLTSSASAGAFSASAKLNREQVRSKNEASLLEIINNRVIQAAALAWAIAQGIKVLLTLAISRRFDYTRVFGSGGMPSSHSAMACAMLMVVGLHEGFSSAVFALAFCFAGVTMYDAAGVRRSTGRNAAVINHIVEGLSGKGFNFDDEHLKELVGHTPIQVLAGALLGILVGVLMA